MNRIAVRRTQRAPAHSFMPRTCCILLHLALIMPAPLWSAEPGTCADLNISDIVARLVARNHATAETLVGYVSTRRYHLEFHGVDSMVADLVVRASYRAPDRKEFSVESRSGSGFLQKRVLERLLKSEIEAAQPKNREQVALTPQNYTFRLAGCEEVSERTAYVLEATPRHINKFLVRGRIYVDDQDFAVIRVMAEPANNPSWWTIRNEIEQTYAKIGDFWLPARNTTLTRVRLLGRASLTIDYGQYELMSASAVDRAPCCCDSGACERL